MARSICAREPVPRVASKARGSALPAGPQARRSQQRWLGRLLPLHLRDPSPQPGVSYRTGAALCLRLVGSGFALRELQIRLPPALLCRQCGSPPVRYIPARKVGAASVQPAPPAAARRPTPAGKAGTPAGEAGMGGWGGEKLGSRTRGEGAARSPTGVGQGPFCPLRRRRCSSRPRPGPERLHRTPCTGRGSALGRRSPRVPAWPSTLSPGSQFPPGTRGACLILV